MWWFTCLFFWPRWRLCLGWIYEICAICNNSFAYSYVQDEDLCPGWIYKMFAICNNSLTYSYVQDEDLCPGYAEDGDLSPGSIY